MKGIVFNLLNELVEEKFGAETWENALEIAHPPSEGAYTAGDTYSEKELKDLVAALSKITKIPEAQLIEVYGEYMFHKLAKRYPILVPSGVSLKNFLKTIDNVIHVEVQKLHPTAELPSFGYEDPSPNQLVMIYQSPRKLCSLAKGLIQGASNHYHEKVVIEEPICMLNGASHCRLELKIES